jgi:hypothetical protein
VERIGRIPTPYLGVRNWNFSEDSDIWVADFIAFDDVIPDGDILIQYGLRIYNRSDEKLVNHTSRA